MNNRQFDIIPAIDILDGKCVRLTQGKFNELEEFSKSPQDIAKKWIDCGAKRLHIVDLDGAKAGHPVNFNVICDIVSSPGIKTQVGGGIRSHEDIKDYLKEGVSYLILGTKAFKDKAFLKEVQKQHGEKIIIGIDLKDKKVALSGWEETTNISLNELANHIADTKQIIYTDITKDGTLSGPDLALLEEVASSIKSNIIVSGGISTQDQILEILNLKNQKHTNISGVILGKSLYKGTIDLTSAIDLVNKVLKAK